MRRTAEERNAEALAAAAAVKAEEAEEVALAGECADANSPLIRPGSIVCT